MGFLEQVRLRTEVKMHVWGAEGTGETTWAREPGKCSADWRSAWRRLASVHSNRLLTLRSFGRLIFNKAISKQQFKAWTYLPLSYVVGTGSPVTGASGWWGWTAATSEVRPRHLEAAGKPSCGRAAADTLGESPARCSSSSQLPSQAPRTRAVPTP